MRGASVSIMNSKTSKSDNCINLEIAVASIFLNTTKSLFGFLVRAKLLRLGFQWSYQCLLDPLGVRPIISFNKTFNAVYTTVQSKKVTDVVKMT